MADKKKPTTSGRPAEETPPQTPEEQQTYYKLLLCYRGLRPHTFVRPSGRTQGRHASAPDSQQKKVGAEPNVVTISVEEFENLKVQLERSQRHNIEIQTELKTTKKRALSKDIQLHRELTQLEQKEQHALQRVHDVQRDVEEKQTEIQLIRQRELQTLKRASELQTLKRALDAQEAAD